MARTLEERLPELRRLFAVLLLLLTTAVPAHAQTLPREFIYFGGQLVAYQANFVDVPLGDAQYAFVKTVANLGITGGCGPSLYCPSLAVTRDTMAILLLRSKFGRTYAPPPCLPPNIFTDVPETSPYCPWVEDLANRGVVGGCGGTSYCPSNAVTREQMAVFLLRTLDPALNPPACTTPTRFSDVPATSPYCRWIEELARRGIAGGCGGSLFCPTQPVTRGQVAVLLVGTFGLH